MGKKKQCPYCGKWFKRLGAHKCKVKGKVKEKKGYSRKIPKWMQENDIDVEDVIFILAKTLNERSGKEKWKFYRRLVQRLNTCMAELVEDGVDISSIR